jgi:hypothetical protein
MVNAAAAAAHDHGSYRLSCGPLDIGPSYGLATGALKLTRWTSKASGLRVVHIDHPGCGALRLPLDWR